MDAILGECSLERLRRRRTYKWRTYPADVLPAFVAEMDFDVAEPVTAAVRDALDNGDLGYPDKGELGDAFAGVRRRAAGLGGRPGPGLRHPRRDDRHHRDAAWR